MFEEEIKILTGKDTVRGCRYFEELSKESSKSDKYYEMTDDAWCCVRPSGTEPKVKFYMGVKGKSIKDAEEKLEKVKKSMLELSEK